MSLTMGLRIRDRDGLIGLRRLDGAIAVGLRAGVGRSIERARAVQVPRAGRFAIALAFCRHLKISRSEASAPFKGRKRGEGWGPRAP